MPGNGILPLELFRNRPHFSPRRLHRNIVAQPSNSKKVIKSPRMLMRTQYIDGSPELGIAAQREGKRPRQHADNRIGLIVQIYGSSNHIGPRAKPSSPRPIAQDHYIRTAWPVFPGVEISPQDRLYAKRAEKSAAHPFALHRLSAGARAQKIAASCVNIERAERLVLSLPVKKVRIRKRPARQLRVALVD